MAARGTTVTTEDFPGQGCADFTLLQEVKASPSRMPFKAKSLKWPREKELSRVMEMFCISTKMMVTLAYMVVHIHGR